MKITKLAKSVLAASALTVASFGANAGAIASATLDVFDFGLFNVDSQTPFTGVIVDNSDFLGTTTASDGNSTIYQLSDNDLLNLGYDNFDISASSAFSASQVTFNGAHEQTGAAGTTYAYSERGTFGTATATSNLENTATFTINNGEGDSDELLNLGFSFSFYYNLIAELFDEGGTAQSSVNVSMNLKDSNGNLIDLWVTDAMNIFSTTSMGTDFDTSDKFGNQEGGGMEARYLQLLEGESYTLFITQNSEVDISSVAEPTSVAILGLSLLGLAGAARRRKS